MSLIGSRTLSPAVAGWYGKLPAVGDFVGRGLPRAWTGRVDDWFQQGLVQLRHQRPDWHYDFAKASAWSFIAPAGIFADAPTMGCLAASHDSVGRQFPLILLSALQPGVGVGQHLPPHCRWHGAIQELIQDGLLEPLSPDQFQAEFERVCQLNPVPQPAANSTSGADILDVLGPAAMSAEQTYQSAFAWTDVLMDFEPNGQRSYWWTLGGGSGSARRIHEGECTPKLFMSLFTESRPYHPPLPNG